MAMFPHDRRDLWRACKFPVTTTATCWNCHKPFEVVFADLESKRHACSHCGTVHCFDLPAEEPGRERRSTAVRTRGRLQRSLVTMKNQAQRNARQQKKGEFMDNKKGGKPFKGVAKEKDKRRK
jgi:hypothetical protein